MEMVGGVLVCACVLLIYYTWRVVNWGYVRPTRLERNLRAQGLKGNPYRLVNGDFNEMKAMAEEAKSKPINFDDDIKTRINAFYAKTLDKYGKECFFWSGPTPTVMVTDSELVKKVMNKSNLYVKVKNPNPVTRLVQGLVSYEGDKWAKHRKLINPAFHVEKLKLMIPAFHSSCEEVLDKWEHTVLYKMEAVLAQLDLDETLLGINKMSSMKKPEEKEMKVLLSPQEEGPLQGLLDLKKLYRRSVCGWL